MTEQDFLRVCSEIEQEKEFLNSVSQDIWKNPELSYEERHAHEVLTRALAKYGFQVQKHYMLSTAFRAELSSKEGAGPTVAIILEYDALPELGHACGHNLIAEAGLAAAMAVKRAMEADCSLHGKLVVLGTPAEEGGGGKIKMLNEGAFDGIHAAMMAHPSLYNHVSPVLLCYVQYVLEFKGKEAHAGATPWEGRNALDAAVCCYQSIGLLRQQIKPTWRIQTIITKGGTVANVIPSLTTMEVHLRTPTRPERKDLQAKIEACFTSSAIATGCEVQFQCIETGSYDNMVTNKTLANVYKKHAERLGIDTDPGSSRRDFAFGSTDMGNVSHVIPSIHPMFAIQAESINHTKEFAEGSGSTLAQGPTLLAGKAMAMTVLEIFRSSNILQEAREEFETDIV